MGTLLRIAGCIPAFSTRGKGALGPLLSALAGASKRETPTSNLTESTVSDVILLSFYFVLRISKNKLYCEKLIGRDLIKFNVLPF